MLTRTDTALDRPMILFQDIVEILHRSMVTAKLQHFFRYFISFCGIIVTFSHGHLRSM